MFWQGYGSAAREAGGVLSFFPAEAYFTMTAMSERALAYSEESFIHRVIVITRRPRRSILLGRLSAKGASTTTRLSRPRTVPAACGSSKEGPTALVITTTRVHIHHENETRMFAVTISDSERQTAAIIKTQASDKPRPDLSEWHELDQFLQQAEHRVAVDFAEDLAALIKPVAVRLRRDFPSLLSLIRPTRSCTGRRGTKTKLAVSGRPTRTTRRSDV